MVQEKGNELDNLEKLRRALAGLDICYLALVSDFAQHLLQFQDSLEKIEKAKRN